jgi:hypothetical protein
MAVFDGFVTSGSLAILRHDNCGICGDFGYCERIFNLKIRFQAFGISAPSPIEYLLRHHG